MTARREIEFRGKRIVDEMFKGRSKNRGVKTAGQWAYGYYEVDAYDESYIYIISGSDKSSVARIDPATVGQYTGLKDKNGAKIFEGDIVKNGLSGTWKVGPLNGGSFDLYGIDGKYKDKCFIISALNSQCEVIGNIHDNPELLEETKC